MISNGDNDDVDDDDDDDDDESMLVLWSSSSLLSVVISSFDPPPRSMLLMFRTKLLSRSYEEHNDDVLIFAFVLAVAALVVVELKRGILPLYLELLSLFVSLKWTFPQTIVGMDTTNNNNIHKYKYNMVIHDIENLPVVEFIVVVVVRSDSRM